MAKKSDRKVHVIMHMQSNAFLVIGPLLAKFFDFAKYETSLMKPIGWM